MGCGSSSEAVSSALGERANGHHKMANGDGKNGHRNDHNDGLPTVMLPDTPVKPKPPIAFEIPLEDIDGKGRSVTTPPPHLQRLLQPPQPEISLPDIEEKLAEAEERRKMILQQRAASAQKRTQKMMNKSFNEMDKLDSEHEQTPMESLDSNKHTNMHHTPPEPGVCEAKNI